MKRITGENGYIALVLIVSFTSLIYTILMTKAVRHCCQRYMKKKQTVLPYAIEEPV
jgi:hypothetical protein